MGKRGRSGSSKLELELPSPEKGRSDKKKTNQNVFSAFLKLNIDAVHREAEIQPYIFPTKGNVKTIRAYTSNYLNRKLIIN
jgi:hypothetical protein